ncbi:MAG TPA: FAD-dependent oxidoreductase [Terriglobia bacterium]|jgi:predicted NAD/FAD-binding protein
MKIGIIGAGGAGLATAWLLQEHHSVTIFESANRLGGHAHTVEVDIDGKAVPIDAGVDFFTPTLWPTFYRLLSILAVPLYEYPGTVVLHSKDRRQTYLMPAVRDGGVCWPVFRPRVLPKLLQFRYALLRAMPMIEAQDTSITIERFTESLKVSRSFKDEFFYPLLFAIWCAGEDDFKTFAAYNGLKYYACCEAGRFSKFYFTEVVGGTRVYIDALAGTLKTVKVKMATPIRQILSVAQRFRVEDAGGGVDEFDHLVIATNASEAARLVSEMEFAEPVRRELENFKYFKGTIAVHGDRRLMPANEKHWSVFNIRNDAGRSALTVWKKWKSRTPLFKSWINYEAQLPEPLYALETYDHPKVTPEYFEAQRRLARMQGRGNLWFAGVYTHDIDSHESAILSAMKVAQRLAPQSANLNRLL